MAAEGNGIVAIHQWGRQTGGIGIGSTGLAGAKQSSCAQSGNKGGASGGSGVGKDLVSGGTQVAQIS